MRTPSYSLPTSAPVYLGIVKRVTSWPALARRGVSSVTNVSNPPHLAGTPRAPKMAILIESAMVRVSTASHRFLQGTNRESAHRALAASLAHVFGQCTVGEDFADGVAPLGNQDSPGSESVPVIRRRPQSRPCHRAAARPPDGLSHRLEHNVT